MRMPMVTMHSVVMKRIQSVLSFCAMSVLFLQTIHNFLEDFSAMLVTFELVEARARRRQQHRVPRRPVGERVLDRGAEGPALDQRRRTRQCLADLARGGTDQQRRTRFRRQRFAQRAIIETLVLSAQDD